MEWETLIIVGGLVWFYLHVYEGFRKAFPYDTKEIDRKLNEMVEEAYRKR